MNRRTDRNSQQICRRLSSKYLKMVVTLISAFILFNVIVYFSIQYIINPITTILTTEMTTTTTTTSAATTVESTTKKSFDFGCFFETTNITLADGSLRPLNTLTTDDEVLVYSSSGQLQTSRVLTVFHHQRPSVRFLDIYTIDNEEPLRLTPTHSILTRKTDNQPASFHYDFAYNLAIGDLIFSSKLQSVRVTNIKEIILYNQTISTPLTFEGNIIVNNLIASCYATFNHQLMHFFTTPLRYWYQIERSSRFNSLIVHLIDFYSMRKF